MANKEFAVFGLGKFGYSVAETLAKSGCEVLAVDNNEEKIQEIADVVTYAVKADVTDPDVLQSLGISNLDGAVVAISDNLEASIMATILAKELGVGYVIAKAQNERHATVLKKVGADAIIFPEKEMGVRTAHNMISGNFVDLVELSSTFSMAEMGIPAAWVGNSLRLLNIRDQYGVNVIGVKRGENLDVDINPDLPLEAGDTLVLVGSNDSLRKIRQR